ncbi:TetR/AcrR family transcriptional regulator [Novosphingobium sp. G106]|nr:TetR/AcrR family transcriptional regulator [Novosphingobium sp. G106]
MGPAGSANWLAMLDGAEDILREEGYAALTSRAVAERIGVKQRLVYYYFATMDDLIVETFRRLSVRELERMRQIAATPRPLHELWDVLITTTDARLITEFTALANRSEGLRVEVIAFIEQSRAIQVEALTAALKAKGRDTAIAPIGLVLLATSAALSLTREAELGVTAGHVELAGAIGAFLREVED